MVDRYGVVPRKRRTCGLHDPASDLGGVSARSGLDGLLSVRDGWSGWRIAGLAHLRQATLAAAT